MTLFCYKPQSAYYEMYGYYGVKTLYKTIQYERKRNVRYSDGKRNDIGATMEAYTNAYLEQQKLVIVFEAFGADALTVNGYLEQTEYSLIDACNKSDKGISFCKDQINLLVSFRTLIGDKTVYARVECANNGSTMYGKYGYSSVGAVVELHTQNSLKNEKGFATHISLVPGYGAQAAEKALQHLTVKVLALSLTPSRAVRRIQNEGCDERNLQQ